MGLKARVGTATILAAVWASAPAADTPRDADGIGQRLERIESRLAEREAGESVERGRRLFARACAACHGARGDGLGPAAADLDPPPRNFLDARFRFRSTPSGAMPLPGDLERTIRSGLPGTAMPGFGELFSNREIAELVAFVTSLAPEHLRATPLPAHVVTRPAAPPEPHSAGEGRGIYLLLECWACHGLDGSGRGPSSEGLTGEAGRPLPATDFRYAPLKGGRSADALIRTLVTGLNGTPMPSYEEAMLFAAEDVRDISSLEGRISPGEQRALAAFIEASPTRAAIDSLGPAGRTALKERRLEALAHYVLSLDGRRGLFFRLFRERPEREPRRGGSGGVR